MRMRYIFSAALIFILLSCGCRKGDESERYLNTTVASEVQARDLTTIKALPAGVFVRPASNIRPFGGTVSHHLLCSPVINEWFFNLKKLRDVGTFIIISPNHGRLGRGAVSLTERDWNTAGKITRTNRKLAGEILRDLEIGMDDGAFVNEHGVEALLPFINGYFPDSDVVPVLLDEKQRHMPLLMKLSETLHRMMKNDRSIFLLISVDFSHRGDRAVTERNDGGSYEALKAMGKGKRIVSDNNGGLMVMFDICGKMNIENTYVFCHTDSEKFAPGIGYDITSYFFTFQY
ncbi:MAG: AmmeMemoRadiSam system protein B [Spirochaetes bacterium]|jgi:hypothetical protein|nr:AmmeMemoRadiSam system protein B [Spirochaetota bacterium]